jgi:hypothetical protein
MDTCAFVFLEDISDALPRLKNQSSRFQWTLPMAAAYERLEEDMSEALNAHRGNRSVLSTVLNGLLFYPDHPYGLGKLYGFENGRRRAQAAVSAPLSGDANRNVSGHTDLILSA